MSLTYGEYLKLNQLLNLQEPQSDPAEHDELLFIVIHQVYELWFKQVLHEIDRLKGQFDADDLFGSIGTLKRVRMILKTLVGQLDVLETMTPLSFMAFRDRLETASGFQSLQFRELEGDHAVLDIRRMIAHTGAHSASEVSILEDELDVLDSHLLMEHYETRFIRLNF